jgi:membrane protein YqaA with SNARE-associated domain
MNNYLNVFIEAAHKASLIPFASEATLYAMKSFGSYNIQLAIILAIAGATLGQMLNWAAGRLLVRRMPLIPAAQHSKIVFGGVMVILTCIALISFLQIFWFVKENTLPIFFLALAVDLLIYISLIRVFIKKPEFYGNQFTRIQPFLFMALFFCWFPLGNLLVLIAGMGGVKIKKALPVIVAGLIFHYATN